MKISAVSSDSKPGVSTLGSLEQLILNWQEAGMAPEAIATQLVDRASCALRESGGDELVAAFFAQVSDEYWRAAEDASTDGTNAAADTH